MPSYFGFIIINWEELNNNMTCKIHHQLMRSQFCTKLDYGPNETDWDIAKNLNIMRIIFLDEHNTDSTRTDVHRRSYECAMNKTTFRFDFDATFSSSKKSFLLHPEKVTK